MKQLLLVSICILSFCISSFAQVSETFDIATFRSPTGWAKRTSEASLQLSTEDKAKGSYCLITLLKSVPGIGDPKKNFDAAWQTIVKEAVTVPAAPQMFPSDNKEDWQAVGGYSPFEKDGEKGVAVLFTLTGYGKMINILVLTNTMDYEPTITAFLETVSLKKVETVAPQPAAQNGQAIVGTWGTSSDERTGGGAMGYIKREYTFKADGTYIFLSKMFTPYSAKLVFGRETGTYRVSGETLTITPRSSVLEGWSKKNNTDQWGARLDSQNRKLESITYRFTKHYFSGIDKWNLVLFADAVTVRDGPFNGGTAFNNAWLYGPPCDQCFIQSPN